MVRPDRLGEREFEIKMTPEAKEVIVERGFDPAFGARPLRRIIRQLIEDPLSEEVLAGKFKPGDLILMDKKNGDLVFKKGSRRAPKKKEVGTAPAPGQEDSKEA